MGRRAPCSAASAVRASVGYDSVFEELLDALPAVGGKSGRARRWPEKLHADKGYDYARCRTYLRRRRIKDRIARKGIERNDRLGRHRCVIERHRFETLRHACRVIGDWINFYNQKRPHQALHMKTPAEAYALAG